MNTILLNLEQFMGNQGIEENIVIICIQGQYEINVQTIWTHIMYKMTE